MKPPVQKGDVHGLSGRLFGAGLGQGGCRVVKHGFGHAVEQQPDAHAGGKEHGKPAQGRKLRPGVGSAHADVAEPADENHQNEYEHDVHGPYKEPPGVGGDGRLQKLEGVSDIPLKKMVATTKKTMSPAEVKKAQGWTSR